MWFKSYEHFHLLTSTGGTDAGRCFANQCLGNVKMYKYAIFGQNIPCGSRVLSNFTKIPRPARLMLAEASPPFCIAGTGQC